jgi:hypothetical protein
MNTILKPIKKLILATCFSLAKNLKFTNKRISQHLAGHCHHIEIINTYELKYILLRIYPFVKMLFVQHQINLFRGRKNVRKPYLLDNRFFPRQGTPEILFTTTNVLYAEIVQDCSTFCCTSFSIRQ